MSIQKHLQGLSKKTEKALADGEFEKTDFKKIPGGVHADDLVAFANSGGGQLLVGVIESTKSETQSGTVVGCDVGDGPILQILNRASSCVPAISTKIFIENLGDKPIMRVVVPDSTTKPHCTPKGVYLKREGTRNRAMQPGELLNIFLEIEASTFAEKFESAADRIALELNDLEESLDSSISRMADQLGWADSQLGDTESTVSSILSVVTQIRDNTIDTNSRLRALFQQDDRSDPVKLREKEKLIEDLETQLRGKPELRRAVIEGRELSFSAKGKTAVELSQEDMRNAFHEAAGTIRKEAEMERYECVMKKPSELSEKQIAQIVALINRGGEVSDGVQGRISRSNLIGLILFDSHPVGVAAIKRPLKSYKTSVFSKSISPIDSAEYQLELGWIFLKENHRQKGLMTPLLEGMLESISGSSVFATTRTSNVVMMELLKQFGFEHSGKPYASIQHPDEKISLYLKPKS